MALGDLHVFTGEEYVDTELAPLLNENFNSLKEYVDDASRWQVMPVQFKGTNAKFLIHETTLGTGTTQVLPLVVLDNTDIAKFSACSLKVVMSTKNGSTAAVNCDINLQKVHNSNECNVNFNTTNSDDAKAEPCTFTYNNIKYAGLKLTTGNADTLWVSGYTTEEWIAPVVDTSVTNLVTLGSDMNVIPTLFKSLQTDKSPVNDYDVVNKKSLNDLTNIKTYSQLSQIGLSGGVLDNSPYAIGNALPANSMLITPITGTANTYNYPKTSGQLVVIRSNSNRVYYEVQGSNGNANIENYVGLYIIDQVSTDTVLAWKRILTDVDTGYWQPNETVTKDTVRKLVGKQYAGCFLVCKVAGTTGSTQPSPDPADGAGIGGGSGSITFYSSLEEIGITPGQESFASIHSALPINSVLEYTTNNSHSLKPFNTWGHFRASKLSSLSNMTFFLYQGILQDGTNNTGNLWFTYYNQDTDNTPLWTQVAKQSDLTNLSNSVVKTLDNVTPTNGNINMWNWLHRYPASDFANGLTTTQWCAKGLFSTYFGGSSQTFPQKPAGWGQLINIPATTYSEATQLFIEQSSGRIWYRGTNTTAELDTVEFKRLANVDEVPSLAGTWTISKGTNGWARESSTGFTIQWGTASGTTSVTFPRTFTTCYAIVANGTSHDSSRPADTGGVRIASKSNTGFTVYKHRLGDEQYNSGSSSSAFTGNWVAYGIS